MNRRTAFAVWGVWGLIGSRRLAVLGRWCEVRARRHTSAALRWIVHGPVRNGLDEMEVW